MTGTHEPREPQDPVERPRGRAGVASSAAPGWDELVAADDVSPDGVSPDGTQHVEPSAAPDADAELSRVRGWGRIIRGNRTIWIAALVAFGCLAAGLLAGHFLFGPPTADVPDAGLVTVPVEYGELSNDVTVRADVGYADAVDVSIDTSTLSGAAIVTGAVPEVGAELGPLSVALEITGRPVIVLPGDLPAYRTLRMGVSGPDVLQLKQALVTVGLNPGDTASNVFDQATADAVAQLYAQAGYPVPPAPEGADDAFRAAGDSLRAAEEGVASARRALSQANAGPGAVEVRQADNAVAAAQRALQAAQAEGGDVAAARDDLALAQLQREQLNAAPDTSSERSMVASAEQQVASAREELERAREAVQPYLPASEVLYLTELPRRVDSIAAVRGGVLPATAMTVSGASVRLTAGAAASDAALLTEGAQATFELSDGTEHRATITAVTSGANESARWQVLLEPDPLTTEQMQQLQGTNVRVKIPVGATEGAVLSVPVAALTAGPGGESRVEIVDGDPRDGERAKTRIVVVEPGLAARGAVEITAVEGRIEEGDLVVVGR